jgi:hypothetical protein
MGTTKRKPTKKQLANLEKGREKLFKKQLKEKGINPNPKPRIIERRTEVVRQPIVNNTTQHNTTIKMQFSLFKQFFKNELFPININNEEKNVNMKKFLENIWSKLSTHSSLILNNRKKIISLQKEIDKNDKNNSKQFKELKDYIKKLEDRIEELEVAKEIEGD